MSSGGTLLLWYYSVEYMTANNTVFMKESLSVVHVLFNRVSWHHKNQSHGIFCIAVEFLDLTLVDFTVYAKETSNFKLVLSNV